MAIEPKYKDSIKLNKNPDRRPDKQDPHFKGLGNFGDLEFWANCWVNTDGDGNKWLNIKLKEKDGRPLGEQFKESLGADPLEGIGDGPNDGPKETATPTPRAHDDDVPF